MEVWAGKLETNRASVFVCLVCLRARAGYGGRRLTRRTRGYCRSGRVSGKCETRRIIYSGRVTALQRWTLVAERAAVLVAAKRAVVVCVIRGRIWEIYASAALRSALALLQHGGGSSSEAYRQLCILLLSGIRHGGSEEGNSQPKHGQRQQRRVDVLPVVIFCSCSWDA